MNDETPQFVEKFNESIKEIEVFIFLTRGSELQSQAIEKAIDVKSSASEYKATYIELGNETLANMLLGYECVLDSLAAELRMWIALKNDEPDKAWNCLVDAQMASVDAARSHEGFSHLAQHYERLYAIEKVVFPPQVFVSSGLIVKKQECSICGEDYEECAHLVGHPYMGEFCSIIARDIDLDHVAIVDEPADKRCRIEQFECQGGKRNRLTWRISEDGKV